MHRLAFAVVLLTACQLSSDPVAQVDAGPDATSIDGAIDAAPDMGCAGVDGDVIFYLSMNRPAGNSWPDLTGNHDATTVDGAGTTVTGPIPLCGDAYNTAGGQYMMVPDSAEFDLGEGSIDLFALVPAPGQFRGIISRDALNQVNPGHFGINFDENNQVVVRIQDTAISSFRCSPAQTEGEWIRIAVNIGPPDLELYVDGTLAAEATAEGGNTTCGGVFTGGIAGNDNPWLIGFSAGLSDEGAATPTSSPLDSAVDEIRLSRVRRVY